MGRLNKSNFHNYLHSLSSCCSGRNCLPLACGPGGPCLIPTSDPFFLLLGKNKQGPHSQVCWSLTVTQWIKEHILEGIYEEESSYCC